MKFVRITNNGAIPAKDVSDTVRALRLLSGWRACPRCNGTRVLPYVGTIDTDESHAWHLRRACVSCAQTKEPGWFQPGQRKDAAALGYYTDEIEEWEALKKWDKARR